MEIYDDSNRICPTRPSGTVYDRHYRKNAAGKELFLVGGALFLLIGSLAFVSGMVECFPTPAKPALLLLAGSLPQFLAGGLGIKFRHYPNMAGLCGAAALLALAVSVLWVFLNEQYALGICSGMSTLVYMVAWCISHR